MKTVRTAQSTILAAVTVFKSESVKCTESLGRILAEDVLSNRNHPPYDISAMDGYAVIYDDIDGATKESPAVLKIIDDIKAGDAPKVTLTTGTASRIMTGAPIPEGADTVIRVEDTDCNETDAKILIPSKKGSNIRLLGENLRTDDLVLTKGTDIGPAELGILAMVKKALVEVYRRPRVAILSSGDELEGLDDPFDERKIPDANTYTVMAEMQAIGIEPVLLGIARDNPGELKDKLKEGLECDALIVSGGVSVGHHDFVRPTLKELGVEIDFWRVALRPGHPFAFGRRAEGNKLIFALPGNPVSSMVCAEEFIIPAMRKMMGAVNLFRKTITVRLGEDVKDKVGRTHFMRSHLSVNESGEQTLKLTGSQGSGILMSMVTADALLVMPAECSELKAGTLVTAQLLNLNGPGAFQEEPGIKE
ncbi:MAG: molybdopterin molybdotransferase MoeA [Deltaproteobacteria bacterium]|nr:molybdopterin molybdotransferase MoeA [Deltaproteobacteria bacterium]